MDRGFWWWLERVGVVVTIGTPISLGVAALWAYANEQDLAGWLIVALVGFAAGSALATLTTHTYVSLRPRRDFKVLSVSREYRFDETTPGMQVSATHQRLKALNNQAQFLEYRYHWSGGGVDHGIKVGAPGFHVFGPVQHDVWKSCFIHLGTPSPRGVVREIEWRHTLEDPGFTMATFLSAAGRGGDITLRLCFSSHKLPVGSRVYFRELSRSGPERCFDEKPVDLQHNCAEWTVRNTRRNRSYGLYWEW